MASYFYAKNDAINGVQSHIVNIIFLTFIFIYVIFYAVNRENKQKEMIIKLESDNFEIQALYEEMAAAEETLRYNYDELIQYRDQIEYYAFHNASTGFFNKDYMIQSIKQYNQNSREDSVLIYFGVIAFDQLSSSIGQTMVEVLHFIMGTTIQKIIESEPLCEIYDLTSCRFGVWLKGNSLEPVYCETLIDKIVNQLGEIEIMESTTINVSVAAGCVKIQPQYEQEEDLWLDYAEIAMLASTTNGNGNCTWFNETFYQKKQYENKIERDLRDAIQNNQLHVVAQPQFDRSQKIIGAELLVRWNHQEYGLISPMVFIPLAEKLGLVEGIGKFVLKQCIECQLTLKERSIDIPLSINISIIELMNGKYADEVLKEIKRHHLSPKSINFELTETAMASQLDVVKNSIDQFVADQIDIHLDDFGTGYSSLNYLTQFPISTLKIDKTFVDKIFQSQRDLHVIHSIIDLGHRIELKVLAEGVETKEQFEMLLEMDCDAFQGYYFAKPLELESFFLMLDELL